MSTLINATLRTVFTQRLGLKADVDDLSRCEALDSPEKPKTDEMRLLLDGHEEAAWRHI